MWYEFWNPSKSGFIGGLITGSIILTAVVIIFHFINL